MNQTKGIFVALEGIDGAGKSTVARDIFEYYRSHGRFFVATEEPTSGTIGRHIRNILDGLAPAPQSNLSFQQLFVEDRRDHILTFLAPELAKGTYVLSDRYWLSTLAYGMLENPLEHYTELHQAVIGLDMINPDLTLILDVTPEEGMRRIQGDGRQFDWFAKRDKLAAIRKNYLALARRLDLGKIAVIHAMRPRNMVLAECVSYIDTLLTAPKSLR